MLQQFNIKSDNDMNESLQNDNTQIESTIFQKKIGSTIYTVSSHFSKTSKSTLEDKILRMLENEVVNFSKTIVK